VPFLNLVRPKQMVDDAWSAASLPRQRPPLYVHLWWAVLLLSSLFSRVATSSNGTSLKALADTDRLSAWSDGFDIIAACLAVAVVVGTTRRVRSLEIHGAPLLGAATGQRPSSPIAAAVHQRVDARATATARHNRFQ
jgi:hypothetical protein